MYVHSLEDAEDTKNPAYIEALRHVKKQGKIKATAISTHTNMPQVIDAAVDMGYEVILTSFNFTMADDEAMMNAIKKAHKNGVGLIAMKTMAGGARWPNPESRQNYSNSTVITSLLKWVMNNKEITTCIPGFSNFDHLNEDWPVAFDLEYTEEEKNLLKDNNIKLSLGFCRQCRQCLASCPNSTEIPTLMRTHMYAAQYGDFWLARDTYDKIPKRKSLDVCKSCNECTAKCVHSTVVIASRIEDLKLIYA